MWLGQNFIFNAIWLANLIKITTYKFIQLNIKLITLHPCAYYKPWNIYNETNNCLFNMVCGAFSEEQSLHCKFTGGAKENKWSLGPFETLHLNSNSDVMYNKKLRITAE